MPERTVEARYDGVNPEREDGILITIPRDDGQMSQFQTKVSCKYTETGMPNLTEGETYRFTLKVKAMESGKGNFYDLVSMGGGTESAPATPPRALSAPLPQPRASAPAGVDPTRQSIEHQKALAESRFAAKDIAELGGLDAEQPVEGEYIALWGRLYEKAVKMLAEG